MVQVQFPQMGLEVGFVFIGYIFSNPYLDPIGQFIEGLKHFTVSDIKFHPQKYIIDIWYFLSSNTI